MRSPDEDAVMREQVTVVIDEVRPYIQSDGGDIELVSVASGVVKVRMRGSCVGCTSAVNTLQLGIGRRLGREVPGFKTLEAI